MVEEPTLKAYKLGCMVAIQRKSWMTQTTKIRPKACQNMHKNYMESSQNHARNKAQSTQHIRAISWNYKTSIQSMHGMSKPTLDRGILWQNNTEYPLQ